MYCSNCGAELPNGSKYCPNCGAKINVKMVSNSEPEPIPTYIVKKTKQLVEPGYNPTKFILILTILLIIYLPFDVVGFFNTPVSLIFLSIAIALSVANFVMMIIVLSNSNKISISSGINPLMIKLPYAITFGLNFAVSVPTIVFSYMGSFGGLLACYIIC